MGIGFFLISGELVIFNSGACLISFVFRFLSGFY